MHVRQSTAKSALILTSSIAIWLVAWAPFGLWSAMWTHAVRAWRFLGRWPSYAHPDPKDLPPFLLDERIETAIGCAVAILAAIASTYLTRRLSWPRRLAIALAGVIGLWLAAVVLGRWDPGGVVAWYVD